MERPSLRRQLVMIFLGIAIPIGILLGLLLFFSGLYSRNRLAAAASGGLDMFTTNFENQLDSVENYLLNLSLNDATFRSLSEQTDRTRAYLDAYEIAQGFPAVLAANDTLMGVVLRSGSGNLYVGRYGAAAQQLKQKLNLEAYLGQPGQTNKMMTKGWYLRTIGQRLYLLRSEVDPADAEAVEPKLRDIQIDLKYEDGVQHVILNGEDVSGLIRTPEVSMAASACASVPAVRKFLFSAQVDMAKKYNVIMDGRDIGTTILPNAQVKIFLTASPEVRAERRYKELKEKGVDVSYEETLADVIRRDKQDEKQSKAAEDSVLLDNSELDFNGTVKRLLEIVEERTGVKHG